MSGWIWQPRTPKGVRTGGEWEIGRLPESTVSLLEAPTPDTSGRWPRIPASFETFPVQWRNQIMQDLPYIDPEAGASPENIEAIRATLKAADSLNVQPTHGEMDRHVAVCNGAMRVVEAFGGRHALAIMVGQDVSARAAQIAGFTDEDLHQDWADRLADAQAEVRQVESKTDWDPTELNEARHKVVQIHYGRDDQTIAEVTAMARARRKALAEYVQIGSSLSLHADSQKRAVKHFEKVAAEDFPASWIDRSAQSEPLMVRYSKSRNHYSPNHIHRVDRKDEELITTETVAPGEHDQFGPGLEPVEKVGEIIEDGVAKEIWSYRTYEVARTDNRYHQQWDREMAGYRRRREKLKATGTWKAVPGMQAERRLLRQTGGQDISRVPMANTGPYAGSGWVEGEDGAAETSTAAHELSHHLEKVVPGVFEMEKSFLEYRTEGSQVERYMNSRTEQIKRGGFPDLYMGKIYWGENRKSTEILSTGVEALFHGRYGALAGTSNRTADPEFRDFLMGMMVLVDPEPVDEQVQPATA